MSLSKAGSIQHTTTLINFANLPETTCMFPENFIQCFRAANLGKTYEQLLSNI